jgi:hypothetical protein
LVKSEKFVRFGFGKKNLPWDVRNWYGQEKKGAGFGEGGNLEPARALCHVLDTWRFKWTVLPLRKFGGVFFTRRVA